MHVAILHNAIPPDAPLEDQDTLVQVEAVAAGLGRLGHRTSKVAAALDLSAMRDELLRLRPDVVFNLVESLDGSDSLMYLPLAVLDVLGLPYVGSHTRAMFLTTHKLLAKGWMQAAGLPTPAWIEGGKKGTGTICRNGPEGASHKWCLSPFSHTFAGAGTIPEKSAWIMKGVWEHGSRDMGDEAVLQDASPAEVRNRLDRRAALTGRPCFAEQFIDGREFAVTVLAGLQSRDRWSRLQNRDRWSRPLADRRSRCDGPEADCHKLLPDTGGGEPAGATNDPPGGATNGRGFVGPEVLLPAEIDFSAFPAGKPRIVGYSAKWCDDRFEYHHTPRRFDYEAADGPLLDELRRLSARCWECFELRGWVRVDFRVDRAGQPWILEINANPCLSPDAGFAAALAQCSIPYDQAIARILEDCDNLEGQKGVGYALA